MPLSFLQQIGRQRPKDSPRLLRNMRRRILIIKYVVVEQLPPGGTISPIKRLETEDAVHQAIQGGLRGTARTCAWYPPVIHQCIDSPQ